jgi:hypothetical protein
MTKVEIKIKDCEPNVKNPHVSAKQQDEIEWKNQNDFDVTIDFDPLPRPIFEGYGNKPNFVVSAHGSHTVSVLRDAPAGHYDYDIDSDKCADEINPDTIIVDP